MTAPKILYIYGSGRNGSTVLANILGSIDGFVSVGEIFYAWDRVLVEDRLCGCGKPSQSCAFWNDIWSALGIDPTDGERLVKLREQAMRAPLSWLWPLRRRALRKSQAEFGELLQSTYEAIAEHTNARVIVDSSKRPSYAYALSRNEGLDVHFLHLIRDSRAVAFSWLRKKVNPDIPGGGYMRRHSATKSSIAWALWNAIAEVGSRVLNRPSLRLRYEDFTAEPRRSIQTIVEFLGEHETLPSFVGDNKVSVVANHSVSGNPSRFEIGTVEIKSDDEWRNAMRRRDRLASTVLTAPQLLWYGYLRKR